MTMRQASARGSTWTYADLVSPEFETRESGAQAFEPRNRGYPVLHEVDGLQLLKVLDPRRDRSQ